MIDPRTGALYFTDGFSIGPETLAMALDVYQKVSFTIPGWRRYLLGSHPSEHGEFEVEGIVTSSARLLVVMLRHDHEFYDISSDGDAERQTFHQGVVTKDLAGQYEYNWGVVLLHTAQKENKNSIIIVYTPESAMPLQKRETLKILLEHEQIQTPA
jgi:hypothetical protein